MIKTFTQDDVVRYIYNETSDKENKEIEYALSIDSDLQDVYNEMTAIKDQLDQTYKLPSDKVTENIMNYSNSFNLRSKK